MEVLKINYKNCSKCLKYLPATREYFYFNKKSKDGLASWCKSCTIEKQKQYNEENKEKYSDYKHEWHKENKEKVNLKCRKWEKNNKDRRKVINKNFIENNPDKLKEYSKKRGKKNHRISVIEWDECKKYFNNSCAYCELHISEHFNLYKREMRWTDLHKEHVDANGKNDLSNCVPSCQSCNSQKKLRLFSEWYNESNDNFTKERYDRIIKWLNEDYLKYIKKLW